MLLYLVFLIEDVFYNAYAEVLDLLLHELYVHLYVRLKI